MSSLSKELVFLILQFLDEEKFKETVRKLEQESGFYFNMKYFEDQVQAGEWDEVERYLSGFTEIDDNRYSMKIFFEIRKQKYLEALDNKDREKAVEILVKDLRIFSSFNEELYKEITQLLTLDNFRENEQLSKYGDTESARIIMLSELKKLIEANPLFRDKLAFPSLKASRIRTLINQSLNWQHQLCKNPQPSPVIKTLFADHNCVPSNETRTPPPANSTLVDSVSKGGAVPAIGAHIPFQPAAATHPSALVGWMVNSVPLAPHTVVAAAPSPLVSQPHPAALLKHPRTPPNNGNPGLDYQSADSEHLVKVSHPGQLDELREYLKCTIDNAKKEKEAAEEETIRNEENTRKMLSMEESLMSKVAQDSRKLEIKAETNSKKELMEAMELIHSLREEAGREEVAAKHVKEEEAKGGLDIFSKVEELRKMIACAKETNDMRVGEVYGERKTLAIEAQELRSRLEKLSVEKDEAFCMIEELGENLKATINNAKKEKETAEETIRNDEAGKMLSMEEGLITKVAQDSRKLEIEAETNSKLRKFLIDCGHMVAALQGGVSELSDYVKLLKEQMDRGITEITNGYLNISLAAPPRCQDIDGYLTSFHDNIFRCILSMAHGRNVDISMSKFSMQSDSSDSQGTESLHSSLCETIDSEEMDDITTGVEIPMAETDAESHVLSLQSPNFFVEAEKQQYLKIDSDDGEWQIL